MSEEPTVAVETTIEAAPAPEVVETETPITEAPAGYTPDELAADDFDWANADRNRLPAGIRKNLARIESDAGRKLKAETERQIEERLRQLETRQPQTASATTEPKDFTEARQFVERDPDKAAEWLENKIEALNSALRTDLDDASRREYQAALNNAHMLLAKVPDARLKQLNEQHQMGQVFQAHQTFLRQHIPDIDAVAPQLNEFAVKEFSDVGLSMDDIGVLTDPRLGVTLAQMTGKPEYVKIPAMITRIAHKLYTKANAGKTAKAKEDKTPPRTLQPGQTTTTKNTNLQALLKKAQETKAEEDVLAYMAAKNKVAQRR